MNIQVEPGAAAGPSVSARRELSRRQFLRGAGITLSLPLLNSRVPLFAGAPTAATGPVAETTPRRMFAICNNLGLLPDLFFPKETGRGYSLSPYLEHLKEHRDNLNFTSVRELEQRMQMSREWERKPRPTVSASVPLDPESPRAYMEKVRLMYDLARLAFETDSTRSIALLLDSVNSPAIDMDGVKITDGYHNLSHHGRSDTKLAQLRAIDEWHMKMLADLFAGLKNAREEGETLLDRTMILYGSNLGNANTHVTTNLPTIFAGGGFRHGQHLGFDRERNYPLPNLFVSMLQRMGIETDKFASATGTMRGLEMA